MIGSAALRAEVEAAISAACGAFRIERALPASGGCIHSSYVLEGGGRRYFAKINSASLSEVFAVEKDGLEALAAAGVRVPTALCHGKSEDGAFLVLEYLDLRPSGDQAALGRALAALHLRRGGEFGWHRDNFIGSTPQKNGRSDSWTSFWLGRRLLPQLELAAAKGLGGDLLRKGERLAAALPALLAGHEPAPSLLHGDLWSGNAGFLAGGAPALFDPAVYRGDRETDLAMSELFGGLSEDFHAAYREAAPVGAGYEARKTLYNLYHVLNHANLFGGGYAAQAGRMMEKLISDAG